MSRHSDAKKARRKKRRDARDTRWVPDQVMDSILKAGEPAELAARWHDEASPLLVIADPAGAVRYVGGYGRHKQSPVVEDLAILADLRAAHDRAALPVFGCATSARLARRVDPLGLARWR